MGGCEGRPSRLGRPRPSTPGAVPVQAQAQHPKQKNKNKLIPAASPTKATTLPHFMCTHSCRAFPALGPPHPPSSNIDNLGTWLLVVHNRRLRIHKMVSCAGDHDLQLSAELCIQVSHDLCRGTGLRQVHEQRASVPVAPDARHNLSSQRVCVFAVQNLCAHANVYICK